MISVLVGWGTISMFPLRRSHGTPSFSKQLRRRKNWTAGRRARGTSSGGISAPPKTIERGPPLRILCEKYMPLRVAWLQDATVPPPVCVGRRAHTPLSCRHRTLQSSGHGWLGPLSSCVRVDCLKSRVAYLMHSENRHGGEQTPRYIASNASRLSRRNNVTAERESGAGNSSPVSLLEIYPPNLKKNIGGRGNGCEEGAEK